MRKKQHWARLAALCMALCMLLAGCANPLDLLQEFADELTGETIIKERVEYDGDIVRRYTSDSPYVRNLEHFDNMEYHRPDVDALLVELEALVEDVKNAESLDDVLESNNTGGWLLADYYTSYVMAMVNTYRDYTDEFWQEEYDYMLETETEVELVADEFTRAMVEGPFADEYRELVGDYMFESMTSSLLLTDPTVKDLKQERNKITIEYHQLINNMTVTYEGVEYTMEDISEIYDTGDVLLYQELYTKYYGDNVQEMGELYLRLVSLDKQIASALGFDSAAEMYYLTYSRDYTPAEALAYCQNTKDILGDIVPYVLYRTYGEDIPMDYEDTLVGIREIVGRVDEEMVDAWDDMMYYGLYDFEARPTKESGVGFTTYFNWYDAPYTYVYWTEDYAAASTIIHEFGHFFDNWLHFDVSVVSNLDTSETYSQGLEVLSFAHLGALTGQRESAVNRSLGGLMQSITYQMLLEELQLRVFELDDPTVEDVSTIYTQLLVEYGYSMYAWPSEDGLDHTWFDVTHMFDYPFYTISYATSAMVALQLYDVAQEDWTGAADIYIDMLHADQNQPYMELVESVGLKRPDDRSVIYGVYDIYYDAFIYEEDEITRQAA